MSADITHRTWFHFNWVRCEVTQFAWQRPIGQTARPTSFWLVAAAVNWVASWCIGPKYCSTTYYSMWRLCYTSMTSVCLSVTLVDCDHIVQQEWKSTHKSIHVGVLATCLLKTIRIIISCDSELYWGKEVCNVLHFGGNSLRNGASYTLDQYRTLIVNRIWPIEWYYLRLPTATESARNRVRNPTSSRPTVR